MNSRFSLRTRFGRLRLVGYAEGVSFLLLLFVAMPLKYIAGKPQMVSIVGLVHGLLFVLYIVQVVQATVEYRWGIKVLLLGVLASVLPFGPFVADARLFRAAEHTQHAEPTGHAASGHTIN